MLRQCLDHGYFRGENCPVCNQKGRFLMNSNELNSLGRIMAGILRHFPEKFRLDMDSNGWVVINTMIQAVRTRVSQFHWLRPHHILALVETDPKGRYQIKDNVIRATYGHSIDVDLDLPTEDIPEKLYYPTTREEVELLMETGLKPSDRKEVHLSLTSEDAENAGKFRVPNPIILEIDAKGSIDAGNTIKHAGITVFTTSEIPSEFIRILDEKITKEIMAPTDGAKGKVKSISDSTKESEEVDKVEKDVEGETEEKAKEKKSKSSKDSKTKKSKGSGAKKTKASPKTKKKTKTTKTKK